MPPNKILWGIIKSLERVEITEMKLILYQNLLVASNDNAIQAPAMLTVVHRDYYMEEKL